MSRARGFAQKVEYFSADLCVSLQPLRLKSPFNAEVAEIRRRPQRKTQCRRTSSTLCAKPNCKRDDRVPAGHGWRLFSDAGLYFSRS